MQNMQHPSTLPESVPVLIVGGGPSGLFLALDLASRGIPSLIIEPRTEIDPTRPRAKTTNARTMTHMRRLGLAQSLRRAAPLPVGHAQDVVFCSSLSGHEVSRFNNAFQLETGRYEPQPECGQQVPQPVVEEVLRAAVQASDLADLHCGLRVTELVPGAANGADERAPHFVVVVDGQGTETIIAADYVIGADGATSVVRKSLGIALDGSSATLSNVSVLFKSRDLAQHIQMGEAVQYWVLNEKAAGMIGRLNRGSTWWAIIQGVDPEQGVVDPAASIRTMVGADIDVETIATDPWTARMLLADSYGRDGIFLVGDAAHLNPPWGGHGFNTCVGDAANLAWKLAAVIHGWAGKELLRSYESERRAVAARTIRDAAMNGKALAHDFAGADLAAEGVVGAAARAAAKNALEVKRSEFHALGLVLGYNYADSAVVTGDGSLPPAEDAIRYEPSTVPGCLLPHYWLEENQSLYDVLGDGFTLLLDAARFVDGHGDAELRMLAESAAGLGVPLAIRTVSSASVREFSTLWEARALLVRPDQHIAWRGDHVADVGNALLVATGRTPVALEGSCTDSRLRTAAGFRDASCV